MSKFKAGDKVIRTEEYTGFPDFNSFMKKGGEYTVSLVLGDSGIIELVGSLGRFDASYFKLVEAEQEATNVEPFKTMKFRVANHEESVLLQKHLFSLGYKWYTVGENPHFSDRPYLYTDVNGYLLWDDTGFEDQPEPEYKLEEIKSYKLIPVEKDDSKYIIIEGKKYLRKLVDNLLEGMEERG